MNEGCAVSLLLLIPVVIVVGALIGLGLGLLLGFLASANLLP